MDTSADRIQAQQMEVELEEEHVRVHKEGDPN